MSEPNNDFLLRRISDLEKERNDARGESAKWKAQYKREKDAFAKHKAEGEPAAKGNKDAIEKLTAERDALIADRDAWKGKAESSPNEWKSKAEELQTKLRERDAKDAWSAVLGKDSLHEKVTVEKLWTELGYTPGEAAPTPEEITEQVTKARESVPFLFKTVADTTTEAHKGPKPPAKPPLRDTVSVSRGAPDTTASRVTVRKSQLQDPKWKLNPQNTKLISDATKAGTLDIVEG